MAALALRLLHLWQMSGTPYFDVLMGDAKGYDVWARQLAAGDWIGNDVFYQAPLYPYFAGLVYAVFGADVAALRIAQAIVGALSCVLVGYAGAWWFSRRVGLVAGLMLALYAPAIFFDGIVQKSVLDVFFVCAALAILGFLGGSRSAGGSEDPPLQVGERRRGGSLDPPARESAERRGGSLDPPRRSFDAPRRSFDPRGLALIALGIVIGCLALTRENALLLVPVIGAWLWKNDSGSRFLAGRAETRPGVVFLLGLAIVLLPVAVRNYAVGGGFYLTTSQFGSNFYIGNNPQADGTYMSLRFGRGSPEYERRDATEIAERALNRRLTPGEVSSYWTDRALAYIASQPADWLRLQARKVALLVNATEMVDTESQEAHAEYSWPLAVLRPFTHFGVLVPMAVFGVVVTWPQRRRLWVLYAIGLVYAASTVMFFVFARYRYPLVPVLMLFASAGLVWAWDVVKDRHEGREGHEEAKENAVLRDLRAFVAIPLVLVAAIIANWPMLSVNRMRAITDTNLGTAFYEQGRLPEAVDRYRKAIRTQPDYVPAYNNLGVSLRAQGQVDDAIRAYQEGLRLRDDYPDLHFNLGNALMEQNRATEAADHLRRASAVSPDSAAVRNNLGKALAEKGQLAEAVREFEVALALEPDSVIAHRNLGSILPALGRASEALVHLRRAVELEPSNADARYDLGSFWLEAGRFEEAAGEFQAAVAARPGYVEARNNLGIVLASQGKLTEAIAQWEAALKMRPAFEDARRNLDLAKAASRPERGKADKR